MFSITNMMVSSSSFKNSQRRTPSVSLGSLPEDLLVEISSSVAASSLSETFNLGLVSKSFQRLCNDRYVLHRLSLHEIPLFPWFPYRNLEKFSKFMKRCRKNGNPEAIYRKGFVQYFHRNIDQQRRDRGFKHIAKAADKGIQEAQYVYGLILICLGGQKKQKGYKILSSLKRPLMSSTIEEMEKHRKKIRDCMWCDEPMMRHLKRSYVRENCNCDGRIKMFFENNCGWHRDDMITSSACEICLWHHEVQLFFNNIRT